MVDLPWELVQWIVEYCPLYSRYVIMMCCKKFSQVDWSRFCKVYRLRDQTKNALKQLIKNDYCIHWSLSKRPRFVWCLNSNKALYVWTPKTKAWTCGPTFSSLYFKEYRFLDFVRHVSVQLGLSTPCVRRHKYETCVVAHLSESQRPKTFLNIQGQRKIRSSWSLCFKKKNVRWVRAFLEFGISGSVLKIRVRSLEFFV